MKVTVTVELAGVGRSLWLEFDPSVFVSHRGYHAARIGHELVHLVAGAFGDPHDIPLAAAEGLRWARVTPQPTQQRTDRDERADRHAD